jgi:hypothetical protein
MVVELNEVLRLALFQGIGGVAAEVALSVFLPGILVED